MGLGQRQARAVPASDSGVGRPGLPTQGGGSWGWERDGVLSLSPQRAAWGALCFLLCVLFWRWWDPGEEMVWLEVAKEARELQAGQKQLHGVEVIKHY